MTLRAYNTPRDNGLPLHRHIWPQADGQAIANFRAGLDSQGKRYFSAIQGESFGHRYVEEILGYETVFHGDEKSIRQGLDGLYYDAKTDALVVVEFKGQGSRESTLQQRHDWSVATCQKIDRCDPPYSQVSEYERSMAKSVLEHVDRGRPVRYEVVRTQVDETRGQIWSQLEKQSYLEQDLTLEQTMEHRVSGQSQGQAIDYGFEQPNFNQDSLSLGTDWF